MHKTSGIVLLLVALLGACSSKQEQKLSPSEMKAYALEMNTWYKNRQQALTADDGWLNLIGLYWLREGVNSFGSDSANDLAFPASFPKKAGFFKFMNGQVDVLMLPESEFFFNGIRVHSLKIFHPDSAAQAKVLEMGSFRWNVIKRGDKVGIRLRDLDSKLLKDFTSTSFFELNPAYRIEATLGPSESLRSIDILNVLGQTTATPVPGILEFELLGENYRLVPVEEGDKLFIIFADATNGRETYASGRYLYADKPGPDGKVVLDFNKSINPPCVFTAFATCPLPPAQNKLLIKVLAGEKVYGKH